MQPGIWPDRAGPLASAHPLRTKESNHDPVAAMVETVISRYGLAMLTQPFKGSTVTRFA